MGLTDSLKEIYTGIEDGYYGLCDYLQQQLHIPVYDWFITPVETRGIPSLPFFFALLLIIIGGGFFAYTMLFPGMTTIKVQVQQAGFPLSDVPVSLFVDGQKLETINSDADGLAFFENVPIGKEGKIKIDSEGYELFEKTFTIGKENPLITASLQSTDGSVIGGKARVVLKVTDDNGLPLGGATISYFDSESGNYDTLITDAAGSASLMAANERSELSITITKTGYESATTTMFVSSEKTKTVSLRKKSVVDPDGGGGQIKKGEVLVTVENEIGEPVDAVVSLFLLSTDSLLDSARTYESGKAQFRNVDAVGANVYVVVEPRDTSLYLTYDGSGDAQKLTSDEPLEFKVRLVEKIEGGDYNITIIVKDEEGVPIEEAEVKWYNQETNARLSSMETDEYGRVSYESEKTVYATIYKEDYLPTIELDLMAGDERIITLEMVNVDNTAEVKAIVLDADGNFVQGAKVNIHTEEGFFLGLDELTTIEDGTTTFEGVPIELHGVEAKYVLRASAHGVSGTSSSFFLESGEEKEVIIRLAQQTGTAKLQLTDATTAEALIGSGKAQAYLRETDIAVEGGSCGISNGTCSIEIPANKPIYFKVSADGYLDLETEDFTIEFREEKTIEAAMIPSAMRDQLFVTFQGIAEAGKSNFILDYPALTRGSFYLAKFTLNIPPVTQKAGIFVKVSGNDGASAEDDYVAISGFEKPANALITKGFAYKPSSDCSADIISESDASNKLSKWLNYEYLKQQGTKAIVVKIFVKPDATAADEVSIDYRGYGSAGPIFTYSPEDAEFGNMERTEDRDSCYAITNKTKYEITEDKYSCNENACISLQFSSSERNRQARGFSAELGETFEALVSLRALKSFDAPYLEISDDKEVKFYDFAFGGISGSAEGAGEQFFPLDNIRAGETVSGEIEMEGILPAAYSKINLVFGNDNGIIIQYKTVVTITGKNGFMMEVAPLVMQANEDRALNVQLLNAIDESPITDAKVSIEEDETYVYEGNTPESINGDGRENSGADGRYTFRRVHPLSTGTFKVIASRDGFRESQKEIEVTLNEFLEASASTLTLTCDGGSIELTNLMSAKIDVLSKSPCLEVFGDGVNVVSNTETTFSIDGNDGILLTLNPRLEGTSCDISFDAIAGSAHANLRIPVRVDCERLEEACISNAQCGEGLVCDLDAGGICREPVPVACASSTDCEDGKVCNLNTGICEVSTEKVCEPACPEDETCKNGVCINNNIPIVNYCEDPNTHSVYKCIDGGIKVVGKLLGAGSTYYFENGTLRATCPVASPDSEAQICKTLRESKYCKEFVCGEEDTGDEYPEISNNLIEMFLNDDYIFDEKYTLENIAGDSEITGCTIRSPENTASEKMDNFVTVDCHSERNVLHIQADYSLHPFYNPKAASFAADKLVSGKYLIQRGTLYIEFNGYQPKQNKQTALKAIGDGEDRPVHGGYEDNYTVYITELGYEPSLIRIPGGETVIWVNEDKEMRKVVSVAGEFDSKEIYPGETFQHTFAQNGTYNYRDTTRTAVKGVVYVGELDAVCKYKNLNYFAQRFVGYLAKSLTRFFDPSQGKSQQIAYSSVHKFYLTPNGITSMISPGLAPQGVYGYGFNGMQQQWNPADPRINQYYGAYSQNYGTLYSPYSYLGGFGGNINTYSTLSAAQNQGICQKSGGSDFVCNIEINPLLPMNGAAFTIVNDYALIGGSPGQILVRTVSDENKYLMGTYVDKAGPDGFIVGQLTELNEMLLSPPRYATFILTNDPRMIEYSYDEADRRVEINFIGKKGEETVTQIFSAIFGNSQQAFTITINFHINNELGKYAFLKVPASESVITRLTGGTEEVKTSNEPYYFIDNIPTSKIKSELPLKRGDGKFDDLYYYDGDLKESANKLPIRLQRKVKEDVFNVPLASLNIVKADVKYDLIGNVQKEADLKDDKKVPCTGKDYCNNDAYIEAEEDVRNELGQLSQGIKVQRLDFAGFGDYAAQRIAEALKLTLAEYVADKAQFEACKGWEVMGELCTAGPSGTQDFNCYEGEDLYCDNSISGGEFWALNQEQFTLAACDTELLNNYEAIFANRDYDLLTALIMRKLLGRPDFEAKIQYTKPIVGLEGMQISVLYKRAADSGETGGYVLKNYKLFDSSVIGGLEGYISLEKWLSLNAQERAESTAEAPVLSTTTKGNVFEIIAPAGSQRKPQFYYLEKDGEEVSIELDGKGEPNLFTMNKYPIDLSGDKLKLFDSTFNTEELKKLYLVATEDEKKSVEKRVKVESCYLEFAFSGKEGEPKKYSPNFKAGTSPNKCAKSDFDKARDVGNDLMKNKVFNVVLIKDNTLKLLIADKEYACAKPDADPKDCDIEQEVTPTDFAKTPAAITEYALRYLFDEGFVENDLLNMEMNMENDLLNMEKNMEMNMEKKPFDYIKFKDVKTAALEVNAAAFANPSSTNSGGTEKLNSFGVICVNPQTGISKQFYCKDDNSNGEFETVECDSMLTWEEVTTKSVQDAQVRLCESYIQS